MAEEAASSAMPGAMPGGGGAAGIMQKLDEGTQIANKAGDSAIEILNKGQKVTHAVRSFVAPIGKAFARGFRAIEKRKRKRG